MNCALCPVMRRKSRALAAPRLVADDESDDEAENLVWYCAACDKHFKSAPAFDNHQRCVPLHDPLGTCCMRIFKRWLDGRDTVGMVRALSAFSSSLD